MSFVERLNNNYKYTLIMDNEISLGVIVPFYNEELFLTDSVKRLLEIEIAQEIVLVDDCSTDNSFILAKNIANENKNIKIIKTNENIGKGGAVKKGLELISTSHVIIHDADLEYFPEDIPEMFSMIPNNEKSLILGTRTAGTKKRINLYFYTYFGNKILSMIFSVLNAYRISDIASCYWLVKSDDLRKINISEKGFAIEVEVLSKFLRNKFNIIEVPIKYHARSYEDGKKIKIKDGLKIFIKILKYCKLNIFLKDY